MKTVTLNGIDVHYEPKLDGGGVLFGQDFQRVLEPVDRLAEWCCGPGFIGYGLYGAQMCRELHLLDINPEAIGAAGRTRRDNAVPGRDWLSDCFDGCPESFDLIVANPPHVGTDEVIPEWGPIICYRDEGWAIHRKFYSQVRDHLRPGGRVVLQEHVRHSKPEDFAEMIRDGGLRIVDVWDCRYPPLYFLVTEPA